MSIYAKKVDSDEHAEIEMASLQAAGYTNIRRHITQGVCRYVLADPPEPPETGVKPPSLADQVAALQTAFLEFMLREGV